MPSHHRTARVAGALYLVTVVTSVAALVLKAPILADPELLQDSGSAGSLGGAAAALAWAGVLELVLAVTCVGTAVALFPVVRPVSAPPARGFLAARTVEAGLILLGIAAMTALPAVFAPASSGSGRDGATGALVALHDQAFLLGPGLIPAVNALCLAPPLLRARLVPRAIPLVGLVGAPLLLASAGLTLLGRLDQVSTLAGALALPIAAWEISLGLWLLICGVDR